MRNILKLLVLYAFTLLSETVVTCWTACASVTQDLHSNLCTFYNSSLWDQFCEWSRPLNINLPLIWSWLSMTIWLLYFQVRSWSHSSSCWYWRESHFCTWSLPSVSAWERAAWESGAPSVHTWLESVCKKEALASIWVCWVQGPHFSLDVSLVVPTEVYIQLFNGLTWHLGIHGPRMINCTDLTTCCFIGIALCCDEL